MYEQLSKLFLQTTFFKKKRISICSNYFGRDVNSREDRRKNHKLKYSLTKKPVQSHCLQALLSSTSSLPIRVRSRVSYNLLVKQSRLVPDSMLVYALGFVATLIVIVYGYIIKAELPGATSCLSNKYSKPYLRLM